MRTLAVQAGPEKLALVVILSMLAGCGESEAPDNEVNPLRTHAITRVLPATEAITGANIPTLDPATMNDAEIQKALGAGPRCEFRYTMSGNPVLAVKAQSHTDASDGVIKLNTNLVVLKSDVKDRDLVLLAEPIRLALAPDRGWQFREGDQARREEASLALLGHSYH
jgi:hypothetical protein